MMNDENKHMWIKRLFIVAIFILVFFMVFTEIYTISSNKNCLIIQIFDDNDANIHVIDIRHDSQYSFAVDLQNVKIFNTFTPYLAQFGKISNVSYFFNHYYYYLFFSYLFTIILMIIISKLNYYRTQLLFFLSVFGLLISYWGVNNILLQNNHNIGLHTIKYNHFIQDIEVNFKPLSFDDKPRTIFHEIYFICKSIDISTSTNIIILMEGVYNSYPLDDVDIQWNIIKYQTINKENMSYTIKQNVFTSIIIKSIEDLNNFSIYKDDKITKRGMTLLPCFYYNKNILTFIFFFITIISSCGAGILFHVNKNSFMNGCIIGSWGIFSPSALILATFVFYKKQMFDAIYFKKMFLQLFSFITAILLILLISKVI